MKSRTALTAATLALGLATTAGAEVIKLSCKYDDIVAVGQVTLDLEAMTLTLGPSRPIKIAKMTDKWIIAQSASITSYDDDPWATTDSWVINRFTGRFWRSHFGKTLTPLEPENGELMMGKMKGVCVRGF